MVATRGGERGGWEVPRGLYTGSIYHPDSEESSVSRRTVPGSATLVRSHRVPHLTGSPVNVIECQRQRQGSLPSPAHMPID